MIRICFLRLLKTLKNAILLHESSFRIKYENVMPCIFQYLFVLRF